MDLRASQTIESWSEDFAFLISELYLASEMVAAQQARLMDFLEMRYEPEAARGAFEVLKMSYNCVARHWEYFKEVGLIQDKNGRTGISNSLVLALREITFRFPDFLPRLVDEDPRKIVSIAQKYIDGEREDNQNSAQT